LATISKDQKRHCEHLTGYAGDFHKELRGMGNSDCPCLFPPFMPGRHGQEDLPMPPNAVNLTAKQIKLKWNIALCICRKKPYAPLVFNFRMV